MQSQNSKPEAKDNPFLAMIAIVLGLAVCVLSLAQVATRPGLPHQSLRLAQLQAQTSPQVPAGKDNGPAQSEPGGGARPTTPAPEPARPDADAQKAGSQPALPPAPAEKIGEPVGK